MDIFLQMQLALRLNLFGGDLGITLHSKQPLGGEVAGEILYFYSSVGKEFTQLKTLGYLSLKR